MSLEHTYAYFQGTMVFQLINKMIGLIFYLRYDYLRSDYFKHGGYRLSKTTQNLIF